MRTPMWNSFGDILQERANVQKDNIAYTFLTDGEDVEKSISYKELFDEASTIASYLLTCTAKGSTAILFYPPGLEFIKCLYGCFLAGIIAVPSYLPKSNRFFERVESIANNCKAKLILSCSEIPNKSKIEAFVNHKGCKLIYTDLIHDTISGQLPLISRDDVAFIQYTSGSVSTPKGVLISHSNILHNEQLIKDAFQLNNVSAVVGWLPFYHDMGLIGNIIQPVYTGFTSVLMSPYHFLQKPERWLKAISKYKATVSGGPNFAYDLCVKNIDDKSIKDINLSSWKIAFNGAEKVSSATMEQFSCKFGKFGFQKQAFTPCYGMAETTLLISAKKFGTLPISTKKTVEQLQYDRTLTGKDQNLIDVVSCGLVSGFDFVIVDKTFNEVGEGRVGQILVAGKSVTKGYFGNENFSSFVTIKSKTYFQTGDLGFVENNLLYITGRLKEIIIVNGKNYYPYDGV